MHKGEIEIYTTSEGTEITVQLDNDTIWLDAHLIAQLFDVQRPAIVKHINKIYKTGELEKWATCSILEQVAQDGKKRKMNLYNLDMIISVGYRVNSKQATKFRKWATQQLKNYLVKGYAINKKELERATEKFSELQQSLKVIGQVTQNQTLNAEEATSLLKVISEYAYALDLLDKYDHHQLTIETESVENINKLTYTEAIQQIQLWRIKQNAGMLFGNEKDASFKSSLATIYQTFDSKDLYPSIEEKAANLLYFVVKNHSFSDGNKRIAAGLFVYFLDKNKKLYDLGGSKIIADNALVAITIMVAESKPEDKDIMVKLIVNLMMRKE